MIFNSFEFIFFFLPIVWIIYFFLNKWNFTLSKVWLLFGSLFFYSWWNPKYLPLILLSLVMNYLFGCLLGKSPSIHCKKIILTIGIIFNVGLLGFYKYYDFFINNVNFILKSDFRLMHLLLPLGISFYTFQQIGYLVDSYRMETRKYNFLNYSLFVTYFPQLIAGPIVHHSNVMPQFENPSNRKVNAKNITLGLLVFSIGLVKKIGIADTFSLWANRGYNMAESIQFVDAWITALSYTFQIYFDFSGYSDMAIGLGLLFNIHLPINFNSPYKATNIQDFWRRWHITLSNFLTTYIYIPLGGNRKGKYRTYLNILIIFFISGFWHGAGWTFVVWGLAHGFASVIRRIWSKAGYKMHSILAWFITFNFVNASWVLFRSPSFDTAIQMYKGMLGLHGLKIPDQLVSLLHLEIYRFAYPFEINESFLVVVLYIVISLLAVVFLKNSIELKNTFKPTWYNAVFVTILFIYSAYHLQKVTEFLYFNF